MRKLFLIGALVALVFTSCKKDDDAKSFKDQIVGTWDVTASQYGPTPEDEPANFEIKADYTYSVNLPDANHSGTYTVDGNTVTGKAGDMTEILKFDKFSGNNATISYSNGTEQLTLTAVKR